MTKLSPQAQAALNAVTLKRYDVPYYACPKSIDQIRSDVAAALRAVVQELKYFGITEKNILAIAAELEGAND